MIIISSYQFDGAHRRPMDAIFHVLEGKVTFSNFGCSCTSSTDPRVSQPVSKGSHQKLKTKGMLKKCRFNGGLDQFKKK